MWHPKLWEWINELTYTKRHRITLKKNSNLPSIIGIFIDIVEISIGIGIRHYYPSPIVQLYLNCEECFHISCIYVQFLRDFSLPKWTLNANFYLCMNSPHTFLLHFFFPLQLKCSNSLDDAIVFGSIAENLSFEVANK